MTQQQQDGYYWCSVRNDYNAFDAPILVEGDIVRILVGNGGQTHMMFLRGATITPLVLATPERIEALADMMLCWKRTHGETPNYLVADAMLQEMKGGSHDGDSGK